MAKTHKTSPSDVRRHERKMMATRRESIRRHEAKRQIIKTIIDNDSDDFTDNE